MHIQGDQGEVVQVEGDVQGDQREMMTVDQGDVNQGYEKAVDESFGDVGAVDEGAVVGLILFRECCLRIDIF